MDSNLTPLASLNVRLDTLSEYIMDSFLISTAPINPIVLGLSDPYGLPRVSISEVPVRINIYQSIVYEISKHWLLPYWVDEKITHISKWEVIDLTQFGRAQDRTTV